MCHVKENLILKNLIIKRMIRVCTKPTIFFIVFITDVTVTVVSGLAPQIIRSESTNEPVTNVTSVLSTILVFIHNIHKWYSYGNAISFL